MGVALVAALAIAPFAVAAASAFGGTASASATLSAASESGSASAGYAPVWASMGVWGALTALALASLTFAAWSAARRR